jgi:hypothetical protein
MILTWAIKPIEFMHSANKLKISQFWLPRISMVLTDALHAWLLAMLWLWLAADLAELLMEVWTP